MKRRTEDGMTILEVVLAITILLIGIGFVVQSNSLSYHYLGQQELRQQMVFFAAGQMEAALEGQSQFTPYNKFTTNYIDSNNDSSLAQLIPKFQDGTQMPIIAFKVSVSVPGLSNVEMYNYRLQP
ncbi:MAG TPA: hypothetical protein VIM51_05245 [Desulfosporosinus sp.]